MKKKVVGLICDIGVIFIGGIIYAIAINTFSAPNKNRCFGRDGYRVYNELSVQYPDRSFVVAVNVLLFLLSFKFVSKKRFQKRDSHCHNICAYRYNRGYPVVPEIYRRPAACLYFSAAL